MRKQHFAEFVVHFFAVHRSGKRNVFQRKPLRFFVKIFFQIDSAKSGARRRDFQPEFFRKTIPVARRARGRITQSARTHDRNVARNLSFIRTYSRYARHNTYVRHSVGNQVRYLFVQKYGDSRVFAGFFQRFRHVACMIGKRKYSSPAFRF